MTWSAPADDGGAGVTGYDLRHIRSDASNKADAYWTVESGVWSSGALRYELGGLTNGVEYGVQVRAVNIAGEGPWSGSGAGKPRTTPGAPSVNSLTPGDGVLAVAWSVPGNDGGADIIGYDLRYIRSDAASKADANWTVEQGIWTSGELRYELGGLANGVEYDVQVRAGNIAGGGEWSGSITGTPQTIPAAPTINSVVSGDHELTVAWSAPTDTGGLAIQSYDLRYIPSNAPDKADANWAVVDSIWTSGNREHTQSGLDNGVRYDLQLRAVTSTGTGPWSGSASGTPQTAPGAPTINLITPGGSALAAAWSVPADDGGAVITSYDLRYIRSDAADKADANWSGEQDAGSSASLQHTITGLSNGVEYDLQVRAVNIAGDGLWSSTRTGTPRTVPGAPGIDSVTPGDESLAVAWSAPPDTGGAVITSYDLRYIRSGASDKAAANWTVRVGRPEFRRTLRYGLAGLTNGVEVRRAGPRTVQHRRRWPLVRHPHGNAPDGPRSPQHRLCDPGRRVAGRVLVSPPGRRGGRHHGLTTCATSGATRRTRPTPTGARSRGPGVPPACNTPSPG